MYAAAVKKSLTTLKGECTNGMVMTHPVLCNKCDGRDAQEGGSKDVRKCFFIL